MDRRVNFSRSSISWNGPSKGIFRLKSLLTVRDDRSKSGQERIGLGTSVLAGNMYAEMGLLKQPPYLFQVSGSTERQWTYRTFLYRRVFSFRKDRLPMWSKFNGTADTYAIGLFKEHFNLAIKEEPAYPITCAQEIEKYFNLNAFSATVSLKIDHIQYIAEFPVEHINIKPATQAWQVETGPVLFPQLGEKKEIAKYLPCFLHFNSFNSVDVFFDHPFGVRELSAKSGRSALGMPCQIVMSSLPS